MGCASCSPGFWGSGDLSEAGKCREKLWRTHGSPWVRLDLNPGLVLAGLQSPSRATFPQFPVLSQFSGNVGLEKDPQVRFPCGVRAGM